MPVRFRVFSAKGGRQLERVVDLAEPAPVIRLGRRPDVELPLPFPTLSAVHARLGRDANAYWIEDAGSTNGTRVSGVRLTSGERRPLTPGAELHLAQVRLVFEGPTPSADPEPTETTATIARRLAADLLDTPPTPPTPGDPVSRYLEKLEEEPVPRASTFSRSATIISIAVLASIAVVALALLR
jgi:pSer/pThr/pTyr-binding forkhead associated (FHA) protein